MICQAGPGQGYYPPLLQQDLPEYSTLFPMNHKIFQSGWWKQELLLTAGELQVLLCGPCKYPFVHVLLSTLLTLEGTPADLQGYLFMQLSPFRYSAL